MPSFCPKCGVDTPADAAFCAKCGTQLSSDEAVAASTNPAPANPTDPASQAATGNDAPGNDLSFAERFRQGVAAQGIGPTPSDDDPEQQLWQGTYSARAMVGTWIVAGLLSAVAIVVAGMIGFAATGWWITLIGILVAAAAIYGYLLYRQWSVSYLITNQRFIHERGLLRRVTDRIEVIDIDDIGFEQGMIERFLDVGTIRITSSDRTDPEISLPGIENVRQVANILDDARRTERHRRGLHIEAI